MTKLTLVLKGVTNRDISLFHLLIYVFDNLPSFLPSSKTNLTYHLFFKNRSIFELKFLKVLEIFSVKIPSQNEVKSLISL